MTICAKHTADQDRHPSIRTRSDLYRLCRDLTTGMQADCYLLAELAMERSGPSLSIICSNWVFDAVESLGGDAISRIVTGPASSAPGMPSRIFDTRHATFLAESEIDTLLEHGHAEFCIHRITVANRRLFALYSARAARQIGDNAAARAQMILHYALERFLETTQASTARDPLSERERECLSWVSEGKTTDEVALILGVSANTINSYIAHAIQKFGAANRAMAIASAIRGGII